MRRIAKYQSVPVYTEFCDGCSRELDYEKGTEVSVRVEFSFGYFSERDGQTGAFIFCQSCAELLYQQLHQQFPAIAPLELEPDCSEDVRLS